MFESHLSDEHAAKLPEEFGLAVTVLPDNGGYTALGLNFDIAGWGTSRREAIGDLIVLVEDYLEQGFQAGLELEALRRPAPAIYWARWFVGMGLASLRRGRVPTDAPRRVAPPRPLRLGESLREPLPGPARPTVPA